MIPGGLEHYVRLRHCTDLVEVGRGLEFVVFRALDPAGDPVALKVSAGARFGANANDPAVDTRALLQWEHDVTRHLSGLGFPVATPRELVLGEPDILVAEFLPADGTEADQPRLGALLDRLHEMPLPPGFPPSRLSGGELLATRIGRRWAEVAARVPDLPAPIPVPVLAAALAGRPMGSLLHLDIRSANLRCVGGRVAGVVDWSNALAGDPGLEWGRLAEYALVPGNGVDFTAVRAGSRRDLDQEAAAFWVYRLDAAVMLANVFLSGAPEQELGRAAVARLRSVHAELTRRLGAGAGQTPAPARTSQALGAQ
jgi:hypothetical protein